MARLWQTLALALERASAAGRPADSGSPGHEHHSLAQLLACGLIEQSIDPPLFEVGALPPPFVPPSPQEVLLLPGFDPQTAGRAPPSAWN